MTKYNFNIDSNLINTNINRLTNQIWKLIPMWENHEDWRNQLETVLIELTGLNELFNFNGQYLILLSKLEGLKVYAIDFLIYRKTVFEAITLLRGLRIEE
jgi:hypothetical protein